VGPFGEFVIDPPSKAISVPASHTSRGVAMDLIATHRSQSLFGEVTKHEPQTRFTTDRKFGGSCCFPRAIPRNSPGPAMS
jgi:hypothetical protein